MDFVGHFSVVHVVNIIFIAREHGQWQLDDEKRFGNFELETTTNVSLGLYGNTYTILMHVSHVRPAGTPLKMRDLFVSNNCGAGTISYW